MSKNSEVFWYSTVMNAYAQPKMICPRKNILNLLMSQFQIFFPLYLIFTKQRIFRHVINIA